MYCLYMQSRRGGRLRRGGEEELERKWRAGCGLPQAENGADPLRYEFIVSQVELVGSREEAEACDYSATSQIEGIGEVTVGVSRARGSKCERCAPLPSHLRKQLEPHVAMRRARKTARQVDVTNIQKKSAFPSRVVGSAHRWKQQMVETDGTTDGSTSGRPCK